MDTWKVHSCVLFTEIGKLVVLNIDNIGGLNLCSTYQQSINLIYFDLVLLSCNAINKGFNKKNLYPIQTTILKAQYEICRRFLPTYMFFL